MPKQSGNLLPSKQVHTPLKIRIILLNKQPAITAQKNILHNTGIDMAQGLMLLP